MPSGVSRTMPEGRSTTGSPVRGRSSWISRLPDGRVGRPRSLAFSKRTDSPMALWRQLTRGLRNLSNPGRADRDVAEEVGHYLDEVTAELEARGLSPEEARRAARVELGSVTAVRQEVREYGWEN